MRRLWRAFELAKVTTIPSELRQMWLWSTWRTCRRSTRSVLTRLRSGLKTARPWAFRKEHLRRLWDQPGIAEARSFFDHWHQWATTSKLRPVMRLAKTLRSKVDQIISYCRHPITSAGCEGLNSKITSVKIRAAGFRNLERFKTAIFYCGKLLLFIHDVFREGPGGFGSEVVRLDGFVRGVRTGWVW